MRHRRLALVAVISVVSGAVVVTGAVSQGEANHARGTVRTSLRSEILAVAPAVAPAGTAPTYRFTTVDVAGAVDSQISGINRAGAYTGNVVGPESGPFIDSGRAGAAPVFFTLPFAAVVASSVQAAGINSTGGVVGSYTDRRGVFHGFIRTAKGRFKRLNVAGAGRAKGEGTEIAGISPGGVIVGSYVTSAKVAIGFLDRNGRITRIVERSAGHQQGEGTAVEFYSTSGGYGGVYVGPGRAAHGWYVRAGQLHVVNDPAVGRPAPNKGTQLVGVDRSGRLYGIALPATGTAESFSVLGAVFAPIRDPLQAGGPKGATVVLGVSPAGLIVGFYVSNARGQTHAFIGRPAA